MTDNAARHTATDLDALIERVEAGQVKALSIKQPYPHHIFHDGKDVENRDWPTKGRGWFVIHAGVSKTECAPSQYDLPRGGIFELPMDWHERHGLTWHDSKGIVRHPADVRRARQVRDMLKPKDHPNA